MSFRRHLVRVAIENALNEAQGAVALAGALLVIGLVITRHEGLAWAAVALTGVTVLGVYWLRWRAQSWFTPKATDAYGHAQFAREREAAERAGLSRGTESTHG